MDKKKLEMEISRLESANDYLEKELEYLDQTLREVGFSDGLETVKATAFELMDLDE